MNNHAPLPRTLRDPLLRAAKTMPVVAIAGARQTGKSTLVQHLTTDDRLYLTLDDLDVLEVARAGAGDQSAIHAFCERVDDGGRILAMIRQRNLERGDELIACGRCPQRDGRAESSEKLRRGRGPGREGSCSRRE